MQESVDPLKHNDIKKSVFDNILNLTTKKVNINIENKKYMLSYLIKAF